MLPFYGTVHIACTAPRQQQQRQQQQGGGACGALLARDAAEAIVAAFTQRLQLQERITQQVADAVAAATGAAGVLVVVRAAHMCMVARGVENHAGTTLTRAALGEFADSAALRAAFLKAVAARGNAGGSEAAAASTERSLVSPCSCCS
jgi:GTP cyclohydrolase I